MSSRASCTDPSLRCLSIAKNGQSPNTVSKMPLSVPLVSFLPNRHHFWTTSAPCNKPRATITSTPCWGWSRFLVIIRSARSLLDPIAPSHLDPVFLDVFERLEQHRMLAHFRALDHQLLVALDGTNYFSSQAMHCHNCLTRQLTNGHTLSYHAAITPLIVCPGHSQVIALPPED